MSTEKLQKTDMVPRPFRFLGDVTFAPHSEEGKAVGVSRWHAENRGFSFFQKGWDRHADKSTMSSSDINILLVEDDDDMRLTLSDFVSQLGVTVKTARDVPDALRAIQNEAAPFNIVLTDLKLPGGTGMDVVKAAHGRAAESLVTIVTGYASLESAIEAIRLGAYDYITKPFSLDEIGVQIRNMIARVSLSKENARLSERLQEVYQQLEHFQSERVEMLRFQEQLLGSIREATGKLDQLLQENDFSKKAQSGEPGADKSMISGLFHKLERLDEIKKPSVVSPV